MSLRPLVVIVGPTAGGKSALGLFLAEKLGGEIVVCDSTQVYRHFDIGTAKPTAEERKRVRHHLLDLCEPTEGFTAGDYLRLGRQALGGVSRRGKLPIVTAGTGLYLRALLEGLSPLPPRSPELRARLQERADRKGSSYLHRLLARVDPQSARGISPQDAPKLIRALEVVFVARRPRGELFREGRPRLEGYSVTKLGLLPERSALYARIEARIEQMLAAGWLEETKRLHERFGDSAKPFGFIGYKQLAAQLRGEISLAEAVTLIKQETRNFAKRQFTWFRKEPEVEWLAGFGDAATLQAEALVRLRAAVRGS
ncbi:MAG TPA: tRNA (adenosine(37)-N6)-dimethylallyltransferase MiaA [Candidatus Xenobia bacterium]|nr:tRNA (adenosine(37)-N6)-dimethylallyltransferase MiaA [Candidatus Xenobia bacterium]